MKKFILKLENEVIARYGFESAITIKVFKFTEVLRKICHVSAV